MWTAFTARNFRGFRNLRLTPLGRVNLIAGKNNTGKTALLEAINLHSQPQNCEVPFAINNRRSSAPDKAFDVETCSWLFFDREASSGLETMSEEENGERRSLQVWIGDAASVAAKCPEAENALSETLRTPGLRDLWFAGGVRIVQRTEVNGSKYYSVAFPGSWEGLLSGGQIYHHTNHSLFIGSAGRSQEEDAKAFSELEAANRQEALLPSLRVLEQRLQRLSILLLGNKPVVHGNIGLSRLVPVQFMGEGIRRLLSIVLAITTAPGGNVLIDEVENGLHYSVLQDVWRAIGVAARSANVQVFATTHSYECIQAAQQAFAQNAPDDLRLFRLDRHNGEVKAVVYTANTLNTSIDMNLEVR
jgi:hypothetical protein